MRVVLASASPARLDLLSRAGVRAEVMVSGVDEDAHHADDVASLTAVLARAKGRSVAATLAVAEPTLVIAADTMLERAGGAEGKPRDADDARARWRAMSGGTGLIHTGHWVGLLRPDRPAQEASGTATTRVWFARLDDVEIDAYVASGEPLRAAGAFTVNGWGGPFVERIEGDHHNVVGLSLPLLRQLVTGLGLRWTELWTSAHVEQPAEHDRDPGQGDEGGHEERAPEEPAPAHP